MWQDMLLGLIRHGITTAGGYLVATGKLDADSMQQIVGAVMALLGVGWSLVQKKQASSQ